MNFNDEEFLDFFNRLLDRLHQADLNHGSNVINIYASGSQHVDYIQRQYITTPSSALSQGRREQLEPYSDESVARAIVAICGEGKPLDSKQKWAGVHWLLRWECNYPARAKEFCERVATLPLPENLAYKCDYRNIREISTLSFMNADPRELEKVKYSKHDEPLFFQLREVVQALERELRREHNEG